jgi:hypothetical protein
MYPNNTPDPKEKVSLLLKAEVGTCQSSLKKSCGVI